MRTSNMSRANGLLLLASLTLIACSGGERVPERGPPALADAVALGVSNAREPLPGLLTAGQPTPDQLDGLVAAGFTRFISLRSATESGAGWEEERSGAEWTFKRIPVSGADDLTRANVEALDRVLDEAGGAPTVLYCGSGNRVGALLALRAYWLDGASPADAIELGRDAGLTRLEPAVLALLK
jgi:protein tyrosine phosphatase (PTP) superfamily phosphohydrolase (DUF442 family)